MTRKAVFLLIAVLLCPLQMTRGAEPAEPGDTVSLPRADSIRELMQRANAWQVAHPWKETDRNWIRATWYTGVMAAYQATGDQRYLDQAMKWAEKHQYQPGNESAGGNVLTCGQTWLELYAIQKDPKQIEPLVEWLASGRKNTPTGPDRFWYFEANRHYADSLYVGPPTLAMLAEATGDAKYLKYMDDFFWNVHFELYDIEDDLFYRDTRFIQKIPGQMKGFEEVPNHQQSRGSDLYQVSKQGKKVFWSRGNGWVIAGIPRILQHLPKDHPSYKRYETLLKKMAYALKKRQGSDGYWRVNLDDPTDFPMPESSGTGFFTYAIAWGINNGVLPADEFLPVVAKSWQALANGVSDEGMVQWGQQVGAGPYLVRKDESHEYVTGTFLLAGSEMLKLVAKYGKPKAE